MSPQSTAIRSSSDSTSIMLSPISPRPPRGIRRTAPGARVSTGTGAGRYVVLTAALLGYHPAPGAPRKPGQALERLPARVARGKAGRLPHGLLRPPQGRDRLRPVVRRFSSPPGG